MKKDDEHRLQEAAHRIVDGVKLLDVGENACNRVSVHVVEQVYQEENYYTY